MNVCHANLTDIRHTRHVNGILTLYSSVPSAKDVLVPETLLKKRKADAKLREEKQAKALELRKVCFYAPTYVWHAFWPSVDMMYNNHCGLDMEIFVDDVANIPSFGADPKDGGVCLST